MIQVRELNKTYDRRSRTAQTVLRDVSFTLPDRGFVCILGPSGCGKTSLLNAVGGLDEFDSGSVSVDGRTFGRYGSRAFEAARNRDFGYIFQNYYLLDDHSAAYNVYLGLHGLDLSRREKLARVREALRAVDMERYLRRQVGEMSGGQQQRVAIARALARRPRVIFADEPTGNLDEDNTRAVCTLLRQASRDSLVVMVTHEASIARFFADRIITLSDGRITGDETDWERQDLTAATNKIIYTGSLESGEAEQEGVRVRILREPGAAPAELTVAVLRDRIVLKLQDSRAASLGGPEEAPRLAEGFQPAVTLADVDGPEDRLPPEIFRGEAPPLARPGSGVTAGMLLREARRQKKSGGLRRAGTAGFLVLLTALALLTVGDFIALSRVDPDDFITTDSHILSLTLEQGPEANEQRLTDRQQAVLRELADSGADFDFVPKISAKIRYEVTVFPQMESESLRFPNAFSYAPLSRLDETTLLFGQMPRDSDNGIVVDRRVLEAMLEDSSSIVRNGVRDMSYFLGAELELESRSYTPVITGICDSGERTVYLSLPAMMVMRNGSISAIGWSELQRRYSDRVPEGLTLAADECLVNLSQAGEVWAKHVGGIYRVGSSGYTVRGVLSLPDSQAAIVVADEQMDELLLTGITTGEVDLYCADKAEMKTRLKEKAAELGGGDVLLSFSDPYQRQYDSYAQAAHLRADARTIVTATVLAVCVVMLYLLCRAQAQTRLGLVAVYRLLGIPGRKLYAVFLLEGILSALPAVVPAAALTWAAVAAIHRWTDIELAIVLPWQAAALTGAGILACYLLAAVLPLASLLRMPAARLAARYDV